jgi:hypothetical protein
LKSIFYLEGADGVGSHTENTLKIPEKEFADYMSHFASIGDAVVFQMKKEKKIGEVVLDMTSYINERTHGFDIIADACMKIRVFMRDRTYKGKVPTKLHYFLVDHLEAFKFLKSGTSNIYTSFYDGQIPVCFVRASTELMYDMSNGKGYTRLFDKFREYPLLYYMVSPHYEDDSLAPRDPKRFLIKP